MISLIHFFLSLILLFDFNEISTSAQSLFSASFQKKKINALFDLLHVWKEIKKQNAVGGGAITWLRGAITILGEVLVSFVTSQRADFKSCVF